jgi:hypothetical protein
MKRMMVMGAALVVASLTLQAQQSNPTGWGRGSWQAVGSTGTPDETAGSRILLQDNGWAEIRPEISSTSVKLRYNIPPLEGLKGLPDDSYAGYELRARLRDNGPAARVIVTIKALTWPDGSVRVLAQMDSDTLPPGTDRFWGDYLREPGGGFMKHFRPYQEVYWAEAQLIKTAPEGRPGIQAIGILIDQP